MSKALINEVMAWEEGRVPGALRFALFSFKQLISVLSGVVGGRLVRTRKDTNMGSVTD